MFSRLNIPASRQSTGKRRKSIPRFLVISVLLILTAMFYQWMPGRSLSFLFALWLFCGPGFPREWRREIEEEIGEEGSEDPTEQPS